METTNCELDARIGRLMSKVVFKPNSKENNRWSWIGRPERFAKHEVNMGGVSVSYELF